MSCLRLHRLRLGGQRPTNSPAASTEWLLHPHPAELHLGTLKIPTIQRGRPRQRPQTRPTSIVKKLRAAKNHSESPRRTDTPIGLSISRHTGATDIGRRNRRARVIQLICNQLTSSTISSRIVLRKRTALHWIQSIGHSLPGSLHQESRCLLQSYFGHPRCTRPTCTDGRGRAFVTFRV